MLVFEPTNELPCRTTDASPLPRALPLQDRQRGKPLLVHVLGVVLDHVAGLAGDGRGLSVRAAGLEQEYDGGLA